MKKSHTEHLFHFHHIESGKASIFALFMGVGIILAGLVIDLPTVGFIQHATAANATTSVTVLNTPPDWTVYAGEDPGSSTTSPTNVGSQISWRGTATDSSGDSYYLLVCKTGASSTVSGGVPTCAGGNTLNRWAVSALTLSGSSSVAATTTYSSDAESNVWYAWICDNAVSNPQCNPAYSQGVTGTTSSPFAVNHRPSFTVFTDTPATPNPGDVVTWMSTSSDTDSDGTQDTVSFFVCKSADFTGTACGAGGTWCSAIASTTHPACNFTLENPKPDATYTSYGYIIDSHNFAASGAPQNTDSALVVSNVAPSISSSSISLLDTDSVGNLTLTTPFGQTSGFQVKYTVSDANSCTTTVNTKEITTVDFSVYRSGVGSSSCQAAGQYNANNCYPSTVGVGTFGYSCVQDTGTCSGINDSTAAWTCTFPLWHIAEATDGTGVVTDSPYWNQNWRAAVTAGDNNAASSSFTEGTSTPDLASFLAYDVTTSTIPYGGLQPGQQNDPITVETVIRALGNVGLDQTLYGAAMCPTYPTCAGAATNTIAIGEQRYATSSRPYASGTPLLANPGGELEINIGTSSSVTSPSQGTTTWGIRVPGSITLAGSYYGQNTLIGITGESANW